MTFLRTWEFYHMGVFFTPLPPQKNPPPDFRDGPIFGQDNFFYGYVGYSEQVSSVGLMLKASDRILHHPKVAENA